MSRPLAPHEMPGRGMPGRGVSRRRPRPQLASGVIATLGCLGYLGLAALFAWITWSFLNAHAAVLHEHHIWWVIGAALALVLGLSSIWSAMTTPADQKLVKASLAGIPPVDGQRNAFVGPIHAGDEEFRDPTGGQSVVYYEYEITGSSPQGGEITYYQGKRMDAPVIRTRSVSARMLGTPLFFGFDRKKTTDPDKIRSFVEATRFRRVDGDQAAAEEISEWSDANGRISRDLQLRDQPQSFEGLAMTTRAIPEGASVGAFGTWSEKDGSFGAGGHVPLYAMSSGAGARLAGRGSSGCVFVFGMLMLVVSLIVLFGPVLSQEQTTRFPLLADTIGQMRAHRVSEYLDERDRKSARKLARLGLGHGSSVPAMVQLTDELDLVEHLLRNGADPDSKDGFGNTLLMRVSDPMIAERLVARGAATDLRNSSGATVGDEALARWDFGVAVRFVEPEGEGAPLAAAIRNGDSHQVSELLANGLDADAPVRLIREEGSEYVLSPLFYAAAFGDLEAVDLLLAAGASQDVGLAPPLTGAVEARSSAVVNRLVGSGASVAYNGDRSTDPLTRAIDFGSLEMVELLVSLGAGESAEYFGLLRLTDDPRIVEVVEPVIVDPAFERDP